MKKIQSSKVKSQNYRPKFKNGFTFPEILISVALLLIVFLGLFAGFELGLKIVRDSRARITALALANEKIEIVRNLPYEKIGTIGGIPSGAIPQSENASFNNIDYLVKTNIVYIDDPFDGLAPDDALNTDYKRIRVEASWQSYFFLQKPVILITDIAPRGVESTSGGGTIFLTVFDSQGEAVPNASLFIENNQVEPPVSINTQTNSQGQLVLPGAAACNECYKITASKTNFSQDRTYDREEVFEPSKVHLSIIEKQITEASFAIDKLSNLKVSTFTIAGEAYPPKGNISFALLGSKIIGYDEKGRPILKYQSEFKTSPPGEIDILNLEWDDYRIFLGSNPDYDFAGSNPLLPFELIAGANQSLSIVVMAHSDHNLLAIIKATNGEALPGASIRLSNAELGYDETLISAPLDKPDAGGAFFSPLDKATYHLEISLEGYEPYSDDVIIDGQNTEEVILAAL